MTATQKHTSGGLLGRFRTLLLGESRNLEDPNTPITAAQLAGILAGGESGSGETVTPASSMRVSAVFACVRVISDALARMPLITYERTENGRERAKDHPLYRLLKIRPNPDMSAFAFRKTMQANTLLWGNGYAEIVRRRSGMIDALIPIESPRVTPCRENGELRYKVQTDRGMITLLKRDMLHIPGLSYDGICGLSVIAHARQTIGAALAADKFQGTLLKNGLRPSGVLEHPGKIGDAALKNLRESLTHVYGGTANAGKPMILEEGMKWAAAAMPLEDAQFIETGQFRVEEICRWFGVQPHKIQHLARATNNNIEQQSLDFLGDTLAPWVEATEQEFNWKLFGQDEQDTHYVEHLTQAIIQMDANARGQFYERLFRVGGISSDEIRERENMNDLPDGRGRTYWTQSSNMPMPTEDQRDELIDSWIKKGGGPGGSGGPGDDPGSPDPKTDGKVAKDG
ncbi:MAG: phage portal protein [Phycisphaerales bacterium]|nr:MAG: phage portal protein [Phycisphaerales bacterium]